MGYDPTLIAPYKSGLVQYFKPFLIGNDAFTLLDNCYSWRGLIKKREGSIILGRLAKWATSTGITDVSPPVVTAVAHGLLTGDMVWLENVTMTNGTVVTIIPGVVTQVTFIGAPGITAGETITIRGITGTIGKALNGLTYQVISIVGPIVTLNVYTLGLVYTAGGTAFLGGLEGQAFQITKITANTFSLQVLNSVPPTNVPASGTATAADIYLPVVGTRTFLQTSTGNEQLIVFHPKKAFLFNTGTMLFQDISFSVGGAITGITAANPAVVTTTNPHGLQTGDQVVITGVVGTMGPAINGITFLITVLSPTTFSIPVNTIGLVYVSGGVVGILWTGTKDNFFYTSNYATVMWTTNNVDPIRFYNGSTTAGWADHVPIVSGSTTMTECLIILPYKGRLVALSTTEGGTTFFQRARWCQLGTPFVANSPSGFSNDVQAWRSDIPGKGGFNDADTSERIVSAEIIQDTLIVGFQFSTWRLRYTGNEILPFIWERISTQFGSEGTFTTVPFDDHTLQISRRGIVAASFNGVDRIDLVIPDFIDNFETGAIGEGLNRIQGVRDYEKRLVYWIYGDEANNSQSPNKILCFNYQDNTWSTFTQSFTTLGAYKKTTDNTWSTWTTTWDSDTSTWDSPFDQTNSLDIVAGAKDSNVWVIMDTELSTDNGINYNFTITTDLINPYFKEGRRCKLAYYDLYVTTTDNGQITVKNYTDDDPSSPWLIKTVDTNDRAISLNPSKVAKYIRVFLGMVARNHQITITLTPSQLASTLIGPSNFELQGIIFHTRMEGRIKQ